MNTSQPSTPRISAIDHVHFYVADVALAADWYARVLGFKPMPEFLFWHKDGGPLTLADSQNHAHIALFQRDASAPASIALRATADEFVAWKQHFASVGVPARVADHEAAWSLYIEDLDHNSIEITSYEHQKVSDYLA